MNAVTLDLINAVYTKSPAGQQEIQSRSLGLGPLPRRLLVLIDGKRTGHDLAAFVQGHDVNALLSELMTQGCVEARAPAKLDVAPKSAPADKPVTPDGESLADLPASETRSPKEIEMARNFMTNTVNTVFAQNTRLTLLVALQACRTSDDLRRIYPSWVETMSSSAIGLKRLPEFRAKLFKVL